MYKKGLSAVITSLILILLVLAAVAIVWGVVSNLVEEESEKISISQFTIDLDIKSVKVNDSGGIDVKIKRNVGKGDLSGLKFIISDGVKTKIIERKGIIFKELEERDFSLTPIELGDILVKDVSIAPFLKSESGKESISNVVEKFESPTSNKGYILYEDSEDGLTNGWDIYDNDPLGATISNVDDAQRGSKVIEFSGDITNNGYRLRDESGAKWLNTENHIISWNMKYSETFTIYIDVETDTLHGGATPTFHRYIYYTPSNSNHLGVGEYVHHGLGSDAIDNTWRTFSRNLQADLNDAQPGVTILEVNGFWIRGSGRVDYIRMRD